MKEKKIPLFYNKGPLSFIKKIEETKKGTVIKLKSSLNGIDDVDLSCDKKEFRVKFDFNKFYKGERNLGIGKQIERIKFDYGEKIIVFKSLYIDTFSSESVEASINQLYSEGFSKSKKQYFKLVIPYSSSLKMHFQIENILFK